MRYWTFWRCAEAHRGAKMRNAVVFSGTQEQPAEVELDETLVKKQAVYEGNVKVGTYHHCVFGMRKRGSRQTVLYLMEPRFVPVKISDGSGSSFPPPSVEELRGFLMTHVGDWTVLHCDGARAYPGLLEQLLQNASCVFVDQVNHGQQQWTRFQRHTTSTAGGIAKIRVTCGTNLIEGFWHVLKHHSIPHELTANRAQLETYMLALVAKQWYCGDPFTDLGAVVREYVEDFKGAPLQNDPVIRDLLRLPDAAAGDAEQA